MIPLALLLIISLKVRSVGLHSAAETATAGLVTLIPEGLVLLMSVTFAVAAVRLAKRDTLIQQMSATESLASVDTICVDKTGTLTEGELRLKDVVFADDVDPAMGAAVLGRFAASAGNRNQTLETIAERYPGEPGQVTGEVPFSSEWKWSGVSLDGNGAGAGTFVLGAPDILIGSGSLVLAPGMAARLEEETAAAAPRLEPMALVVLEETLREDAAATIAFMREQEVDLKLISGDARATVTAVAYAVGVTRDAGVIEGPELPDDPEELQKVALANTVFCRIQPQQKKALVEALVAAGRYVAMIGDGVNDVPALKQARMAVAMGSGTQVTKGVADVVLLKDEFSRLPEAIGEGRRIARNIHRLGRLYMTKSVYAATLIILVAVPGFAFPFLPRHLTMAAFLTIGIPSFVLALAPSDGPLYRGRLIRALAAFAIPSGVATGIASILSCVLVNTVAGGGLAAGRTAATTTLIFLGLAFVLLLERGPGREGNAVQSYMLAMVAGLGALYALILAAAPVREFFELEILSATQWFLALLSAAVGLTIAALVWRLPVIERWEAEIDEPNEPKSPMEESPRAAA
jgi:cation-transporting ATPase E